MIGAMFLSRRVNIFVWLLFLLSVNSATADEQGRSLSAGQGSESFIEYHLRSGESLGHVAQMFRIPAKELARINNIVNPLQVSTGRTLKVPNVFLRQTARLQEERDHLLAEKERRTQEVEKLQQSQAVMQADLHEAKEKAALAAQLIEEKAVITAQSAVLPYWQKGASFLSVVLGGFLMWIFKLRRERARAAHKLMLLTKENAALKVAKEKSQQAAAQLELRYQKLHHASAETPAKFIAEGKSLIMRAFTEGCVQIDQLLTNIRAERERAEQTPSAGQKVLSFLPHSLRGQSQRHQFKGA